MKLSKVIFTGALSLGLAVPSVVRGDDTTQKQGNRLEIEKVA
jgi:hypothetical protein